MNNQFKIDPEEVQLLIATLRQEGYETVGPVRRDDAIMYDRIVSTEDLPIGWTDEQSPGTYRTYQEGSRAFFGYTIPPQSWKRFLFPPSRKMFSIRKEGKSLQFAEDEETARRYAFIGVRPCELSAIAIQDRVFKSGEYRDDDYLKMRSDNFIVAVNCGRAGDNCFCTSMKTGPKATNGFDISLTEILKEDTHCFVAETRSDRGNLLIEKIGGERATEAEIAAADNVTRETIIQITKSMDTQGLPEILASSLDHSHWDDIAKRCLTCGNCTMVCPTCFCSTIEDTTDLSGRVAERIKRWDSCFTMDFAKVSGGNFRISPKSRYRQWLTHKLSSWVEQFDVPGCVGCGRCITWCPVGIDLTVEVGAIRGAGVKQEKEGGNETPGSD